MIIGTSPDYIAGLTTVKAEVRNDLDQVWNGSSYVASSTLADAAALQALWLSCTEEKLADNSGNGRYRTPDLTDCGVCTVRYYAGTVLFGTQDVGKIAVSVAGSDCSGTFPETTNTAKLSFDLVSSVNYLKVTTYGFMGTLLTGTAALIVAAWQKLFNISTPVNTVNDLATDAHVLAISTSGGGFVRYTTDQVTDPSGNPLDGVEVTISTDNLMAHKVAHGYTDSTGYATLDLDPGDYFQWLQLGRYTFSNPTPITVVA